MVFTEKKKSNARIRVNVPRTRNTLRCHLFVRIYLIFAGSKTTYLTVFRFQV